MSQSHGMLENFIVYGQKKGRECCVFDFFFIKIKVVVLFVVAMYIFMLIQLGQVQAHAENSGLRQQSALSPQRE